MDSQRKETTTSQNFKSEIIINQNYRGYNPVQFGSESCKPGHSFGPTVRTHWLLHYVVYGFGMFQTDNQLWDVKPGDIFVIPPYVETYYQADAKKPWRYIWIGFTSDQEMPEILQKPVIHCPGAGMVFEDMLRCSKLENGRSAFLSGKLWELFSLLLDGGEPSADYVQKALSYMNSEYINGITVRQVAERLNMNRSYFSELFRAQMGISPQKYLINLRLERAAELLTVYGESPSTASLSVGYSDIYHFSRVFKQHFGVSPRNYQKVHGIRQESRNRYVEMRNNMKYLVFGSLNIDRTYSVPHFVSAGETMSARKMELFCGGKGFNQAIALARAGKEVYFSGAVGEDGQMLLDALASEGIHDQYVMRKAGASGHAVIQVDASGQNCILILAGANGEISKEDVDAVLRHFEAGDLILLQNEILNVDYLLQEAARKGMIIAFNPSPWEQGIAKWDLSGVDYLAINEVEGSAISGGRDHEEILKILRQKYPKTNILLTLGENGSLYSGTNGQITHCGIYPAKAVDTTAAGDTFLGYFLAQITDSTDPLTAMKRAAVASGICVSRNGASTSIPYVNEVMAIDHSKLTNTNYK